MKTKFRGRGRGNRSPFCPCFCCRIRSAPPAASKADVQKLVDSIKADKAKMAQFCELNKIDDQARRRKREERREEGGGALQG